MIIRVAPSRWAPVQKGSEDKEVSTLNPYLNPPLGHMPQNVHEMKVNLVRSSCENYQLLR